MSPNRFVAFSLALLAVLIMACWPAHAAEPACPAASAPTLDTECGACGTGRRIGANPYDPSVELITQATPGLRVNRNGAWTLCAMPVEPKSEPTPAASAPTVVAPIATDRCAVSYGTVRNGVQYLLDTRQDGVALGAYADAIGSDGTVLRVQCVAGRFVTASQCAADTVIRRFGPDTRVYAYAGPPVDTGTLVRAEQISSTRDGVTETDPTKFRNGIRWTMARCGASGHLQ